MILFLLMVLVAAKLLFGGISLPEVHIHGWHHFDGGNLIGGIVGGLVGLVMGLVGLIVGGITAAVAVGIALLAVLVGLGTALLPILLPIFIIGWIFFGWGRCSRPSSEPR